MNIKERTDRILSDGRISRTEYEEFLKAVNEDGKLDAEEKQQIQRLIKLINESKVTVE